MARDAAASVNRKTEIISAAIEVFAEIGYFRATTAQVAERIRISQPYIFRFFSSKEALLLAALEASWSRVVEAFRQVVATCPAERLESELIDAYDRIVQSHRHEILLQMQAQTIQEDTIREAMRQGLGEVRTIVLESFRKADIADPEGRTLLFLARGMLCNVSIALGMPELMEK